MNKANLHKLIDRYEENFYILNNSEHDEIFKWRAAKQFRDVWFSKEAEAMPFSAKFALATKHFSVLTDNSYISPSNGVIKIAEHDQDGVRHLFEDFLFAEDSGNLDARQNNTDKFLEEFDRLRIKYYPQSFKFKQDRHSASCYLAFYAPDTTFIYRYSDAEAFAQHIEFGKDIGSGESFRLDCYYEMCEIIVAALREHPDLLEKHFTFLSDKCYPDESLHLLAFDLMYCCRTYNYYNGMSHISKKESIKAFTLKEAREKERLERLARIAELTDERSRLEMRRAQIGEISLLNVEVTQQAYGKGIIIAQQGNKVTVKFDSAEKIFVISKKYPVRPKFENDDETVEVFTEYENLNKRIEALNWQIEHT